MLDEEISRWIDEHLAPLAATAMELSAIPSMTGREERKASRIRELIEERTGRSAAIDTAGNVVCLLDFGRPDDTRLYAAHIDTVFHHLERIDPKDDGTRISAPSILDNSVNAAALLQVIELLGDLERRGFTLPCNLLAAFTTGEEGEGDLRGMRSLFDTMQPLPTEAAALDLGYDSVIIGGIWSKRYRAEFEGPGGHSWKDFGRPSAVAAAAELVHELYRLPLPEVPKTTCNAGIISGGTSVNTIAARASVTVDLRSESQEELDRLDAAFRRIAASCAGGLPASRLVCIGQRPGGSISEAHPMVRRLGEVRRKLGLPLEFTAGSTDANIPLSMGIPAVSFGVGRGGGVHTDEEYLEKDSLKKGMEHLIAFLLTD